MRYNFDKLFFPDALYARKWNSSVQLSHEVVFLAARRHYHRHLLKSQQENANTQLNINTDNRSRSLPLESKHSRPVCAKL